jgi:phage head maturation protease
MTAQRVLHRRDATDSGRVYRRFRAVATQVADDGTLQLVASTDAAVPMGSWREVLVHTPSAIDTTRAASLLINHDPNQIAGSVTGFAIADGELRCVASVMPDAKLATGVSVRAAVNAGALRGVSIGYTYDLNDVTYDEPQRTVTVKRWQALEVSLTPIPADANAGVRACPFDADATGASTNPQPRNPAVHKITLRALLALAATFAHLKDALAARAEIVAADSDATAVGERDLRAWADAQPKPGVAPVATHDESARAEQIADSRELAKMAESHGLTASDYVGMRKSEAQAKMLVDLAAKRATTPPTQAITRVAVDTVDKARDAAIGAVLHRANLTGDRFAAIQNNNPLRGRSMLDIVRGFARMSGEVGCEDWSKTDLAWYALGRREMISGARAANVGISDFTSFVFLDAINKAALAGYEMGSSSVRFQQLVDVQRVADFKTFNIGTLSAGNLVKTAENAAFPELDKSEGKYSSALKMWGGTMSLSLQALVSDDTAQFERNLRMAGVLALKTVDKRVFQKLMMGTSTDEAVSTWTSNTTPSATIAYNTADTGYAARQNVGKVRAALQNKVGLDGNPLGTAPRFLVCGPTREQEAIGLMSVAPGQQTSQNPSLQVVASAWLEAAALAGNSATSYYLLADPKEVTGLMLSYLTGMDTIQVMEYDAGAVAARNWKLFLPFEADLPSISVAGTNTIAAAQQGTP